MGWQNLFHCEINPFGRKVIEYWYPDSTSYENITTTDFTPWRGRIDVLTAGFPCQPFSVAGQRKGADDDRYLWPEMLRAIREIQPAWVVGENVAGILTMVQPDEEVEVESGSTLFGESHRKRVLLRQEYVIETVCRDLEREGYAVQPFVIPACAVGAPHRRDGVWIVARRVVSDPYLDRQRERTHQQVTVSGCKGASYDCACGKDGTASHPDSARQQERIKAGGQPDATEIATGMDIGVERHGGGRIIADTNRTGRQEYHAAQEPKGQGHHSRICAEELPADRWAGFPTTQPVIRRGDDGLPGRLAGITFPRWRQESIKALGNAWVPQVAYEIFKAIEQNEDTNL